MTAVVSRFIGQCSGSLVYLLELLAPGLVTFRGGRAAVVTDALQPGRRPAYDAGGLNCVTQCAPADASGGCHGFVHVHHFACACHSCSAACQGSRVRHCMYLHFSCWFVFDDLSDVLWCAKHLLLARACETEINKAQSPCWRLLVSLSVPVTSLPVNGSGCREVHSWFDTVTGLRYVGGWVD